MADPITTEWILKDFSSSLLARRIELFPSQCLIENLAGYTLQSSTESLHLTEPSFSPFLHVSDRATGDSRWYSQLVSPDLVRKIRSKMYKGEPIVLPLSLHGNAPFMPPARDSVNEVKVQLWSDQALLRSKPGKSLVCDKPLTQSGSRSIGKRLRPRSAPLPILSRSMAIGYSLDLHRPLVAQLGDKSRIRVPVAAGVHHPASFPDTKVQQMRSTAGAVG